MSVEKDPFELIGTPRRGMAYQWVAESVFGRGVPGPSLDNFKETGWKIVPPKWHPKMPKVKNKISLWGQVLMYRPQKAVDKALADNIAVAVNMSAEHQVSIREVGKRFLPEMDAPTPSQEETKDFYERLGEVKKAAEVCNNIVDVTIKLRLSDNQVEAAAITNLTLLDYADRLLKMSGGPHQPLILVEAWDPHRADRSVFFQLSELYFKPISAAS